MKDVWGRWRIPQRDAPDRQNVRRITLAVAKANYTFSPDDLAGDPAPGFTLPPYLAKLPAEAAFNFQKRLELGMHKLQGQLNAKWVGDHQVSVDDYEAMYRLLPRPVTAERWSSDEEFARQRLNGVNPMVLRRVTRGVDSPMSEPAQRVLERQRDDLHRALDAGRIYEADYRALEDPRIARHVQPGRYQASPRVLFCCGEDGVLRPIAIHLRSDFPVVHTPLDDPWAWTLAKWHVQSADGAVHEGIYHLGETHLVTETIAIAAARNLHPDHPLTSLLEKHFAFNLAIDVLARTDMLGPGKAIDQGIAVGAAGALNAARLHFSSGWSWDRRRIAVDLAERGLMDGLPGFYYRDDGLALSGILHTYAGAMLRSIYASDEEVRGDYEVQGWLAETATWLNGFPAAASSLDALADVIGEVIFRASVQHAAVNNGQYDTYGCIPYAPGAMYAPLPDRPRYTEEDAVRALPRGPGATAQMVMAWVLSEPTHYSLVGIGDAMAFSGVANAEAREVVAATRRALQAATLVIARRNENLEVPYVYLDPRNVELSTGT